MIELGIIGCGAVVHDSYARLLVGRTDYAVRYVSDLRESQAESAARIFGAEIVDVDTLSAAADAVIVTTPPSTHAAIVRRCLRPGATVLCEKPYTPEYAEAVALVDEASRNDAALYVGHFRRVFPQVALARKLVSMGLIGKVSSIVAAEGGRFAWHAVSEYTTRDATGGVLWDTGPHTLDMALFAACLDGWTNPDVDVLRLERDKAEPSHAFRADFTIARSGDEVLARLHLSRRNALPNIVRVIGDRGEVAFTVRPDVRLRVTTAAGTTVVSADGQVESLLDCFDRQVRRILLRDRDADFRADSFLGQVKILEALAHA